MKKNAARREAWNQYQKFVEYVANNTLVCDFASTLEL